MIRAVSEQGVVTVAAASAWFGISRQGYYQACQQQAQRAAAEQVLIEMVQGIRQRHPRMGARKLLHELRQPLAALGLRCGRDAFFALLGAHALLVPTKRSRHRTTRAGLWRCATLVQALAVTRVHQVWVADITYLATEQGFVYLALLTDAYSRFIVGYDLSASLAAEGCQRALEQAIARTPPAALRGLIHHSDHGVQYCAYPYTDRLQALGMRASMGEVGNCYENPLAERVNGILKGEYGLDALFVDQRQAQGATREGIYLYNFERPHLALDYAKPAAVHFPAQ